jgi:hypothetical protein
MKSLIAISFLVVLPLAIGCGGGASGEVYHPEAFQGKVDTSLPSELQVRQEVLRRLLHGLQEGIGEVAALRIFVPGVDYRESFEQFYEGQKRLIRWDFNGRPNGNDVPVVLYFDNKESGPVSPETERRVERVYQVSGYGQRFAISRK